MTSVGAPSGAIAGTALRHEIAPEGAPTESQKPVDSRLTVAVAFSGGRDSTALLHSTLRGAADLGLSVVALHVNHGLMPEADQWQQTLTRRCAAWAKRGAALQLVCERITEKPAAGDSVEAWARKIRYQTLRRMALAAGCDSVLLAHHRRDQAETFLLQALRGAGVAGLSAMPAAVERDGIRWLRPWLDQPRSMIDSYVARYRLAFIDDASNADPRFSRNRLRHDVWPALIQAFPQAEQVLGDAARWAAFATECLSELAEIDLQKTADSQGLDLEKWLLLSPARRRNLLRAWLHQRAARPAPASLVNRLIEELPASVATGGASRGGRHWDWGADRLLADRNKLVWVDKPQPAQSASQPVRQTQLAIRQVGSLRPAGWAGVLTVSAVQEGGVPLSRLAALELRPRLGSELFQAGPRRPPRSLKKQFQAVRLPAWQRDGPLLFDAGQELIFVAGLGLDARVVVDHGDTLVSLSWQADEPDSGADSSEPQTAC